MSHSSKKPRPFKGESKIDFPDDYVVIDIETTGYSPYCDFIIEVSAVKYANNMEIDSFSSLVRPDEAKFDGGYVSPAISRLTGITHEMLADAPDAAVVLLELKNFIEDAVLLGHNIGFDVNFLYDNFEKYLNCYLTNDHINTERIFKKLHPEVMRSRLVDMSRLYEVDNSGAHRAINDCITTKLCFDKMKSEILENYSSYKQFVRSNTCGSMSNQMGASSPNQIGAGIDDNKEIDPSNPLFGKVCVFTGALDSMTRKMATNMVLAHGGECGNSVTQKTDYLILGNNDYCSSIKDGKSTKQKRAEELKLEGYDIEIIPESVFLDLLQEQ